MKSKKALKVPFLCLRHVMPPVKHLSWSISFWAINNFEHLRHRSHVPVRIRKVAFLLLMNDCDLMKWKRRFEMWNTEHMLLVKCLQRRVKRKLFCFELVSIKLMHNPTLKKLCSRILYLIDGKIYSCSHYRKY